MGLLPINEHLLMANLLSNISLIIIAWWQFKVNFTKFKTTTEKDILELRKGSTSMDEKIWKKIDQYLESNEKEHKIILQLLNKVDKDLAFFQGQCNAIQESKKIKH